MTERRRYFHKPDSAYYTLKFQNNVFSNQNTYIFFTSMIKSFVPRY